VFSFIYVSICPVNEHGEKSEVCFALALVEAGVSCPQSTKFRSVFRSKGLIDNLTVCSWLWLVNASGWYTFCSGGVWGPNKSGVDLVDYFLTLSDLRGGSWELSPCDSDVPTAIVHFG